MRRRRENERGTARFAAVALLVLAAGCARRPADMNADFSNLTLDPGDRILIAAPHPDDETLGCAGIIQKAVEMKLPVRVVFLTNGDNNEWSFLLYRERPVLAPSQVRGMGEMRQKEALAAGAILGVPPEDMVFLGYPDFGCLHILREHWGDRPPYRSMLTRVTAVPYAGARSPGAPYSGESILSDITGVVREFKPTKIFLSHPADHNPDHLAMYLFFRVALWDLARELTPVVYPYLVHFRRYPAPRGYHPEVKLLPPRRLAGLIPWSSSALDPAADSRKLEALQAHHTQMLASEHYLTSFVRPDEIFGDFPPFFLGGGLPSPDLPSENDPEGEPGSEELTTEERSFFVGIEERSIAREGDDIVLSLRLSRPLIGTVETALLVLGYRSDRPFAQMPKIRVVCGPIESAAFDTGFPLPPGTVSVEREPRLIRIRLPLRALGDPERILTGARTYLEEIPLDFISWRIFLLSPTGQEKDSPKSAIRGDE